MATLTVSSSQNWDESALTGMANGDDIIVDAGVTLTVDGDTQHGQNGAIFANITNNGTILLDGTKVWWVAFDASSGNVPSLGTVGTDDVTIGGSNVGEFLGIYSAYATFPLSSGTAMPTTGYLKLRSKSGTIADNDVLTFAGGATATVNSSTGGQRGWIEFCGTTSNGNRTVTNSAQSTFQATGDWFDLGLTTGSAMTLTLPHYGTVPGIQIETSAGSGVYEWYPNIGSDQTWGAAGLSQHKYVIGVHGQPLLYIGQTSALAAASYVPPANCKIRMPNIVMAGRVSPYGLTNTVYGTRKLYMPQLSNLKGSVLNLDKVSQACFAGNALLPSAYDITNSGLMKGFSCGAQFPSILQLGTIDNCAIGGQPGGHSDGYNFYVSASDSFIVKNTKQAPSNGTYEYMNFNSSSDFTIQNCEGIVAINTARPSFNLTNCENVIFDDCTIRTYRKSLGILGTGCKRIQVNNCKFDAYYFTDNNTGSLASSQPVSMSTSTEISVDGPTFPNGNYPLSMFGGSGTDARLRNIGTRAAPSNWISGKDGPHISGSWVNPQISNCFITGLWLNAYFLVNFIRNGLATNVGSDTSGKWRFATGSFTLVPKGAFAQYGNDDVMVVPMEEGNHFAHINNTTAVGASGTATQSAIMLFCGATIDTNSIRSIGAYEVVNGTGVYNDGDNVYMPNINNEIIWEWNWDILQCTGFQNVNPTITAGNIANIDLYYDLDSGSGYSGSWTSLTAANLSGESISATGYRIKIRAVTNTASAGNYLTSIIIFNDTSISDIDNNPYPTHEPTTIIQGVVTSSLLAIFNQTNGKLIRLKPATSSEVKMISEWYSNNNSVVRIRKPAYDTTQVTYLQTEWNETIPVEQNANELPSTSPGALGISVTDHGASPVTWNGKQFSLSVVVTDSSTSAQIANYINYNLAQDLRNLNASYRNMAFPDMVIQVGSNYETKRGTLFGSAGATLKGVRVVDGSGNEIPGFARMQADDGTYYLPAASYTLTVDNIVSGSRLLLRRTDTQATISNVVVTSGTFTYTYTHTGDIPVEIVVRKATTSPFYQEWSTTTTLSNSNNTQTANQLSDE